MNLKSQRKNTSPVVFLLNSLGLGGSEAKTVGIVNELYKRGWNVHLAYLTARELIRSRVDDGVPLICLNRIGKFSLLAISRLHTYVADIGASTIVCINLYPLVYALPVRCLRGRKRLSVIAMPNTSDHRSKKIRRQMSLYRRLMVLSDKVVFGCYAQLEEWTVLYGLTGASRSVIYNGVDQERFAPGVATASEADDEFMAYFREDDFVIGTVGNLRPEKNQRELISATAEIMDTVPNAKTVIVGEGAERQNLEHAIARAGLRDRVLLTGRLQDVRPILERIDVFVLPSTAEVFSNAALEAMSMEKAVLLSDIHGSREMVEHGVSGYIFKAGDTQTMVRLLTELAADPEARAVLGKRARKAISKKFSFVRMIADYERLLSDGGR